MNDEEIDG